jgi:hypothetical protein
MAHQCAYAFACTVVAQSDTMVAAVHRMLQCAAMASNVVQFKDKDFGQSMDWDASPDALVLSILSPEWEDKPSRETKVLYWNAVATYFDLWRKRAILRMTRTTALKRFFVRHTNCECSAGFPGCSWSCQCPCGYGRDLNVYIHTYILPCLDLIANC